METSLPPNDPLPRRELPAFLRETAGHVPPPRPIATIDPLFERQKLAEYAGAIQRLSATPWVTLTLMLINSIVFIAMAATGSGLFKTTTLQAVRWGADVWQLTTGGQWWRLLTSAFLHFGLMHIAFNMWALYQAGTLVERLYGRWFFALLYLYGAVMSSLASIWWDRPAVTAGASGAIFAVFGAMLAYLVLHRRAFPQAVLQPLMKSTLVFIGYNIFFGLTQKGISNSAHISGLISGFFIGLIVARPLEAVRRHQQTWPRLIAGVLMATITLGGAIYAIPTSDPTQVADLPGDDPASAFNQGVGDLKALPPRYTDALACFKSAAAAGVPEAMQNLGYMYSHGRGTAKDYTEAAAWFRKAADAGLPQGMLALGTCYETGDGVPVDDQQATEWLSKAASGGSVEAMKLLAELYAEDRAGQADFYTTQRMSWFQQAAFADFPEALVAIGMLYERGDGVAPNFAQAMIRYRKAAEAGAPYASRHIGLLYATGLGVPKDLRLAAEWYRKGADAGDPVAMRWLAECYASGNGVQKNPALASTWNHAAEVVGSKK